MAGKTALLPLACPNAGKTASGLGGSDCCSLIRGPDGWTGMGLISSWPREALNWPVIPESRSCSFHHSCTPCLGLISLEIQPAQAAKCQSPPQDPGQSTFPCSLPVFQASNLYPLVDLHRMRALFPPSLGSLSPLPTLSSTWSCPGTKGPASCEKQPTLRLDGLRGRSGKTRQTAIPRVTI